MLSRRRGAVDHLKGDLNSSFIRLLTRMTIVSRVGKWGEDPLILGIIRRLHKDEL
jgi:hypothetical protein